MAALHLLTSAHMKSGVKTKFRSGEGRNAFRSWPRRTTVRRFVRRASAPSSLGCLSAGSRLSADSTRPCASVNALRHTGGTRRLFLFSLEAFSFSSKASPLCLCTSLPGPRSLGSGRARGQASYGDSRATACPLRRFGSLLRLPDPRTAAGSLLARRRSALR
jgi:hypothetical protein